MISVKHINDIDGCIHYANNAGYACKEVEVVHFAE